jgi:hypothetical protein
MIATECFFSRAVTAILMRLSTALDASARIGSEAIQVHD